MLKQIIVVVLMVLISNLVALADSSGNNERDDTAKVRAEIAKLGVGRDAKVNVKLKNGKNIKGYVSETKADSFVVTEKNGTQTEIGYSEVRQAKGQNIPRGVGIAIAIGIGAAIFIGGTFLLGSIFKN